MQEINRVPRLLFVDDEHSILTALRRSLVETQWDIELADSAASALAILEQREFDLVISDMRMPEMNGAVFLETVSRMQPSAVRLMLTGFSDIHDIVSAINQGKIFSYLTKPWDNKELHSALNIAWDYKQREDERLYLQQLTASQNAQLQLLNSELESKVEERTYELKSTMTELESAHKKLKNSYQSTIAMLSHFLDQYEGAKSGNSRWCSKYVVDVAKGMALSDDSIDSLQIAALLHDVGMLGMTEEVHREAYYSLSPRARRIFQSHTILGEAALMEIEGLQDVATIISLHHEYLDGSGYPGGLKAADISMAARVLAVVCDYQACFYGRLLEGRRGSKAAKDYIREYAGTRYDANVVQVFLQCLVQRGLRGTHRRILTTEKLEPGMVLQRDLLADTGVRLLSSGYQLDGALIEKLKRIERETRSHFTLSVNADGSDMDVDLSVT